MKREAHNLRISREFDHAEYYSEINEKPHHSTEMVIGKVLDKPVQVNILVPFLLLKTNFRS